MSRHRRPRTGGIRVPPGGLPAARMMPDPEPGPLTFAAQDVTVEFMAARAWLADHPAPPEPEPSEPIREEPVMGQIPPGPVREAIMDLRAQISTLRTETHHAIAELRAALPSVGVTAVDTGTDLIQLRAEIDELRNTISKVEAEVGIDDADSRIVAFLEAMGGVKMNGMSIATNLGLDPGTCANRLQKLARDDRIHAHREKKRATLYSVPLR